MNDKTEKSIQTLSSRELETITCLFPVQRLNKHHHVSMYVEFNTAEVEEALTLKIAQSPLVASTLSTFFVFPRGYRGMHFSHDEGRSHSYLIRYPLPERCIYLTKFCLVDICVSKACSVTVLSLICGTWICLLPDKMVSFFVIFFHISRSQQS